MHMKFSAMNEDFDGPNLNLLDSKKPATRASKSGTLVKVHYFTVVGQYFMKTVANHHGHAAYHNKH